MAFFRIMILSVLLIAFGVAVRADGPTTVFAPDTRTTPPAGNLPEDVKAFYGKTGKWWGTWYGTPAGHMEAILVVKKIINSQSAEIVYVVPNYPTWSVKAISIERTASFEKKDGKTYLVMPPTSTGQQIRFTFEAGTLVGTNSGPFLTANIVWEPLD